MAETAYGLWPVGRDGGREHPETRFPLAKAQHRTAPGTGGDGAMAWRHGAASSWLALGQNGNPDDETIKVNKGSGSCLAGASVGGSLLRQNLKPVVSLEQGEGAVHIALNIDRV